MDQTEKLFKQKSVESYFLEFNLQDSLKEKVLISITDMVYSRNQRIIELEKELDEEKRKEIMKIISEKDVLIKQKMQEIIEGKDQAVVYDY